MTAPSENPLGLDTTWQRRDPDFYIPVVPTVLVVIAIATVWSLGISQTSSRVGCVGVGVGALTWAFLVGRYGIVGCSYQAGEWTVKPAPISPAVLSPVLLLVALGFFAAATGTSVGHALLRPAEDALMVMALLKAAANFLTFGLLVVVFVVCAVTGERAAAVFGLGMFVFIGLASYASYLIAPAHFRGAWASEVEPFVWAWGLLTGVLGAVI